MLRLTFTTEELDALHRERFHHPDPRVRLKMEVLWLKSQGVPHHRIAALCRVTENTVRNYFEEYMQKGLAEFAKPSPAPVRRNELRDHRARLEAHFREHPPATATRAAADVERLTGVRRSPTQVRAFLKSMGMKLRKVAAIPAKADPDAQDAFKKKIWSLA